MRREMLYAAGLALAVAWAVPARADLVQNGGFETGALTGWSASSGVGIDNTNPYVGSYDAVFTTASGTLSQTLATTPGQGYLLSFAVDDENASVLDSFSVSFGGFSQSLTGDVTGGSYAVEQYVVPGSDITTGSTTLSFSASLDPSSTLAWNLDSVSVTPETASIPEPSALLLLATAGVFGFLIQQMHRRPRGG